MASPSMIDREDRDPGPEPAKAGRKPGRACHYEKKIAPGITVRRAGFDLTDGNSHCMIELAADSLDRLAAFVQSPEGSPAGSFANRPASRHNSPGKDWDDGWGWQKTADRARDGWPEGRDLIRTARASMPGDFHPCPPPDWDVAGGRLCVPSFISGDPCAFEDDLEDAGGRARIIRIVIPLTASCGIKAERMANRGAAIASVIDALEAGGIRVEAEAISTHETGWFQAVIRHRVKEAGAHLNLSNLALSIASPAVFRRLHFAGLEALGGCEVKAWHAGEIYEAKVDSMRSCYGSATRFRHADLEPPGTILLPEIDSDLFKTPGDALHAIREQMAALGLAVDFEGAAP